MVKQHKTYRTLCCAWTAHAVDCY